jgi:hypothetical protein
MKYRAVSKRRKFPRDKRLKEVFIEFKEKQIKADIINVGLGGALIRVNTLFFICDHVLIHFKTESIRAEIRYGKDNYYGVAFLEDAWHIEHFLDMLEREK